MDDFVWYGFPLHPSGSLRLRGGILGDEGADSAPYKGISAACPGHVAVQRESVSDSSAAESRVFKDRLSVHGNNRAVGGGTIPDRAWRWTVAIPALFMG